MVDEGRTIHGTNGADISEEQVIEQQLVPFMGDDLAAALAPGGHIYITLPGMCSALGLNTRGQLQRIQRTRTLSKGLRRIPIKTKGGFQHLNCLRIDLVALWLAGVQPASIKGEIRAKIEAYQDELAPVATQVFLRMMGLQTREVIPTTDPHILALTNRVDALTEITALVREYVEALLEAQGQTSMQLDQAVQLLEALIDRQEVTETQVAKIDERTQRLTPAHGQDVQEIVHLIAAAIVKQSPTITLQLAHALVYGRLKKRFRARSYIEIPDERFDEVMGYLRGVLRTFSGGELPGQGSLF
ncbi:MAG TPA: phage antirepressor N-terminal domain-containing protein [Ktedonobacteraceae bacterium]|nr:phage antirepressor N-terminal domain-containing protein [Ktedonobacteraceae bacterium]